MDRQDKRKLRQQLKSDLIFSPNDIPRELQDELVMNVRKHPWIFAMPGYERALKMKFPKYEDDIDRIFGGQLALGRCLKWED